MNHHRATQRIAKQKKIAECEKLNAINRQMVNALKEIGMASANPQPSRIVGNIADHCVQLVATAQNPVVEIWFKDFKAGISQAKPRLMRCVGLKLLYDGAERSLQSLSYLNHEMNVIRHHNLSNQFGLRMMTVDIKQRISQSATDFS